MGFGLFILRTLFKPWLAMFCSGEISLQPFEDLKKWVIVKVTELASSMEKKEKE